MFTGIVEKLGEVVSLESVSGNLLIGVKSPISNELKIDQSVAHNGACLTVVKVDGDVHFVEAVDETLRKTNLGSLQNGSIINLERCLKMGDRLDGHMVQGHVDCVGLCELKETKEGSTVFGFTYRVDDQSFQTVKKGSICVNGVSLTVVDSEMGKFSVEIIPYTLQNTTFKTLNVGNTVNLEFDIIGKYILQAAKSYS